MALTPFVNNGMIVGVISKSNGNVSDTPEMYQNNGSRNKYYEAQKRSDMYMKLKDRQPMVFEFLQSPNNWISVTMYINPDKLSLAQQKLKGKQVTRGGIFYHHWGDDHPVLSLSGTTGLSGMKGIEVLENIYHASGTLMRFQQYGPSKYNSGNLTTQDNGILNADLSSTVNTVNQAANSRSTAYVKDLKTAIDKTLNVDTAWKQYIANQSTVEFATAGNVLMNKFQDDNKNMRLQYGFPDGKGNPNNVSDANTLVSDYTNIWNEYITNKTAGSNVWNQYQAETNPQKKSALKSQFDDLHNRCAKARREWKLESNIENGNLSNEQLPAERDKWLAAANLYVANHKAWHDALSKTKVNGTSVNVKQTLDDNKNLANQHGFPVGNSEELKTYVTRGKISSENGQSLGNMKVEDLRKMTSNALGQYQSVLSAQGIYDKVSAVKTNLADWSAAEAAKGTPPSADAVSNEARKQYQKITGLDNSVITTLAYQDTIYNINDANEVLGFAQKFAQSGDAAKFGQYQVKPPADSPISYTSDLTYQMAAITADRAKALNDLMAEMSKYEATEQLFREELKANALNDIMDDLQDEWRPRRILLYYENRVYVGHFDQFSYSRDASNPLLIRYDMRITIEKQVIGTNG